MNLDDLRSVQSKERQKDSLQHLRESFYSDVGDYVEQLKDERDRAAERADDPFSSPEVGRLTDEIETAEEVVEAIYERRMGKLVKRASIAAAGMPADDEGLTAEEQDLFEDLVDRIETNKAHVLDVLAGEVDGGDEDAVPPERGDDDGASGDRNDADASPDAAEQPADPEPPSDRPTGEASSVNAADLMGSGPDGDNTPTASDASPASADGSTTDAAAPGASTSDASNPGEPPAEPPSDDGPDAASSDGGVNEPADGDASAASTGDGGPDAPTFDDEPDADRATVRITQDVGEILGVDDREYELTTEDVVTLPETNVEPLVQRDAAERLD
ncbi:DNA replication factor GINS [Natronoarchaeum philippinense]|uniref:DNA replication factor GINS n=1 Tax=Natronoarchaeum philippinense TaxID=558529 RepID=A0A285N1Q6_NATPI|nr:hypothetical protein [Natronoarchaeum philippinense]SNZ03370.1 DNA replication factor GINS [Natronoarchaeum philippinense]